MDLLATIKEMELHGKRTIYQTTIEQLSDKTLVHIFSFLKHQQVLKCARINRKWRTMAYDPRLWANVSLRPEFGGLQVSSVEALLAMISVRMGASLRLIELPMELVQVPVIHELANKCSALQYLTIDFASASQLHDFTDLISFPARLKSLTICLSEVIFLEGFVKRIYSFISSVEVLHLIGTFEKIEDEDVEEVYEVVNITKLKQHIPKLRVVNLWGVVFVTDDHIESLSSTCTLLECLSVCLCQKVKGASIKGLLKRCKKLKTLLMEQCILDSAAVLDADWSGTELLELNITATDLSEECLIKILTSTNLKWLSTGFQERMTDEVLATWLKAGTWKNLRAVDFDTCDSLSESMVGEFIDHTGPQLDALMFGGHPKLVEYFWTINMLKMPDIKILCMGLAEDCCQKVTAKIHTDQFLDSIARTCPKLERLELRWDPNSLRFSDKSSKFIDILRTRCLKLCSLVVSDGQYYELLRSNFERAERSTVVRTTTTNKTSIAVLLRSYNELLFN